MFLLSLLVCLRQAVLLASICSLGSKPAPSFRGLAGVNCDGLLPILIVFWGVIVWMYEGMNGVCLCVTVSDPLSPPTYAWSRMLLMITFYALICQW